MDQIIKISRRRGATIPQPASVEELERCQRDLTNRFFPCIPPRYYSFLQNKCNGYAHGMTFYGTKPFNTNNSGLVEDLVTANKELGHFRYLKHCLLIGHGWNVKYFYNTINELYEVRTRLTIGELREEYNTFGQMFSEEFANWDRA